jgi:hypothetical protein
MGQPCFVRAAARVPTVPPAAATHPSTRFAYGSDDPSRKAIGWVPHIFQVRLLATD